MDRAEGREPHNVRCGSCGQMAPAYDILNYTSADKIPRDICSHCFNAEVAKLGGLDKFEHIRFEPVRLVDCAGKSHKFHFRTHLFGPGVAIDGFELHKGEPSGYQFQIVGEPEDDLLTLLGRLIEKIQRGLAVKHVKTGKHGMQIADHRVLRAMIDWDEDEDGQVPLLIIDGREITWHDLGRMLMTFEGWQFKLEIRDMSAEL
jgi:hypothetical protein